MRKAWTLLSLSLLVVAGAAVANNSRQPTAKKAIVDEVSGQGYGTAGCGLGSIVFGAKPGMIQIVAATLNGWGGQTFAITSGTSNCVSDDEAKRAELFIETNRLALEEDISRGQGETLANFAEILGCGSNEKLGSVLQRNFETIFPSRATSSEAISTKIYETIGADSELSTACLTVS